MIDDPDLTFVNLRNPGAIRISKSAKDVNAESGSSGLGGVEFTITDANGDEVTGSPVTTNANGEACIGGLAVGATYTVTESDVPGGFQVDPTVTQDVTVLDDATCDAGGGGESVSFTNDPLSKITVSFESLATNANGEDRTAATIDCTELTATPADDTPTAFDDASEEFTNLKEGTYNCTVVIDP